MSETRFKFYGLRRLAGQTQFLGNGLWTALDVSYNPVNRQVHGWPVLAGQELERFTPITECWVCRITRPMDYETLTREITRKIERSKRNGSL